MKKEIIFEMESPYRDTMRITAFKFGDYDNQKAEKSLAVVGATRGNEAQQMYNCSQLISKLKILEKKGQIAEGKVITVIPTVNNFSINTGKRFWSMDNTDINRMFPGYNLGETTQRIAHSVFEAVKNYEYGIHFTSYYIPGKFIPHVRIMHTGFEDAETGEDFGLPYVYVRNCKPYDTTTLNYNWQIFGTEAFSLYMGGSSEIEEDFGYLAVESVVRFLIKRGIVLAHTDNGEKSLIIHSKNMISVRATKAGVIHKCLKIGCDVESGDLIGYIMDPYDGKIVQKLTAPVSGKIFFAARGPYEYEGSVVYRIVTE